MASPLEIPVAFCNTCDDIGPVIVEEIKDEDETITFMAVYCPGCCEVINFNKDVEVKWYTETELPEACGWKINEST